MLKIQKMLKEKKENCVLLSKSNPKKGCCFRSGVSKFGPKFVNVFKCLGFDKTENKKFDKYLIQYSLQMAFHCKSFFNF